MEKCLFRKLGIVFSLSLLAIGTTVTISNGLEALPFNANGDTTSYTLTLDSSNGQLNNNGAYVTTEQTNSTAQTTSGNKIQINNNYCAVFSDYGFSDIYAQLKKSLGYFYNTDVTDSTNDIFPLTSITSITATFSSSGSAPVLYLGTSVNPSTNAQTLVSGTTVSVSGTDFFKIAASSAGVCYLTSLVITYSCVAVTPVLQSVNIDDSNTSYAIGTTYNTANGLTVTGIYNTGSQVISSGYAINGSGFDPESAFTTAGTYSVTVTYESIVSNSINVVVYDPSVPIDPTAIAISQSSLALMVGESETLTYSLTPNNATTTVTWSSDNSSLVTVNDGAVTALAAGSAIITVSTANGYSSTCAVTVTAPTYTATINKSNTTILSTTALTSDTEQEYVITDGTNEVGSMSILWSAGSYAPSSYDEVTIPSNTGKISSNDSTYVKTMTLDLYKYDNISVYADGVEVTGVSGTPTANGSSLVYIFTINSSNWYIQNVTSSYTQNIYSMELEVEVGDPSVAVTSVALNSSSLSLGIGETSTLIATVSPSNAGNKVVIWSSSNSSVASISNGLVTAVAEGNATITVTTSDGGHTATCAVTVSAISVTSVALSDSTATVSIGSTKTLIATVSPSNATNKAVSWSTNNSSVATVNEGVITAVAEGNATITVTTSDGGYTATCSVTVSAQALDAWTVMVYMCGADLESGSYHFATGDLTEMINVTGQPDNVNVIVEAGGAQSWSSTYSSVINKNNLNRFHLSNNEFVLDEQIAKADMGSASTFQSFLEWGLTEYPAERTMVVMWNHGGAMGGCCYDENYSDDSLMNSEVNTALNGAFNSLGRTEKLEVIGYDACLMQVQDVAEFNSSYFNYMVASEESEAGYGWDYDGGWLNAIYNNPSTVTTATVLNSVVDTFIADNGGVYSSSNDQTLSWLDLSQMGVYKTAWENMAGYLNSSVLNSSNKTAFQNLVKTCKYYADTDYTYFCTFDAKDFLAKLSASSTFNIGSLSTYISAAQSAFNNVVSYSSCGAGAGNSYGLCMFFSVSSNCGRSVVYTSSQTNFTNWRTTNSSFGV
ncbi:MAG: Ig-like domain-containing protein [Bacilli bacterium]